MADFEEHVQGLDLGADVFLYEFDLRKWGLNFLRIYKGDEGSRTISFDGVEYTPWPLKTEGWKTAAAGRLPRPRITVANPERVLTPMVRGADGFRYAPFKRIKTYERYLDQLPNGDPNPDADGTQHAPPDFYEVNRIVYDGKVKGDEGGVEVIRWELRVPIDRPNAYAPALALVRDRCQFAYRVYNPDTGAFEYEGATCPYAEEGAGKYFDIDDQPTTAENDQCSLLESGCKARYGENAVIPRMAFARIGLVKIR